MDKNSSTPAFQKIQQSFSAHIRDPDHNVYDVKGIPSALSIEDRRLKLYEKLFFNNIYEIFTSQFPVLYSLLGEERWDQILREYMVKHRAKTPLFHELGQEFLIFLQQEYQPIESDPSFMFELAHYEWVEVALAIAPELGFNNTNTSDASVDDCFELSPVAWYLSYQWPVHEISKDSVPESIGEPSTLLVYRDEEDEVQFMALSPLLYHLVAYIDEHAEMTFREIVMTLAENYNQPLERLLPFSETILEMLYSKNIIRPVV
ncbi:HvfC family RiPP maturation protein [Hydrogenovibrio kuenenii]|uniref:HvfC family RiPP maturation protein n=1 Tax=Hydrogenovibrio kuenenii TaxID=63658 RepID=UPI000464586E|nr:putative DNA-binding domain-containing protein [Hydrogenovibrio kuenenii]